ncbi:MAG: Intermembrane transport protein PqiB [Sodalis sp.]|nr:MAG: Intermembrane transport protein PqiB [Sodalis sp.]
MNSDHRVSVPVSIRIEPNRFISKKNFDINKRLTKAKWNGFRAALKSAKLLTGALYVDLIYIHRLKAWLGSSTVNGTRRCRPSALV